MQRIPVAISWPMRVSPANRTAAMKVIYDPQADTLSVHLSDAVVADSDESRPGVILDFDANGGVIGLEILDASRHMPVPPTIDLEIITPAAG